MILADLIPGFDPFQLFFFAREVLEKVLSALVRPRIISRVRGCRVGGVTPTEIFSS